MKYFLYYLTLQGLTSEILGIYQVDYFYFLSLIKNKEGVDSIDTARELLKKNGVRI